MNFTEPIFPFFLLLAFWLYWSSKSSGAKKVWLILFSSLFYGWWDYRFLLLLYLTTVLDFAFATKVERATSSRSKRFWLSLSIISNLGVLGFFKYFNFFTDSAARLLSQLGFEASSPTLNILLPAGISFYTFQSMSYVIDVSRGQIARGKFIDFLVYIIFFPQLVAGPIVRAKDFFSELAKEKDHRKIRYSFYFTLILVGYFKKAVIGDNLAPVVDPIFKNFSAYDWTTCLFALFGFLTQLYCDFSGYSDIAVGTAGLFGFSLLQNFEAPLLATDIRDFWRRWHVSLNSWLRDYLYVPLGGSRRGPVRSMLNVLITFCLGGLWHGAGINFLIWGAFNGVAIVLCSQWLAFRERRRIGPLPVIVSYGLTQAVFLITLVFFRSSDFEAVEKFFSQVVSLGQGVRQPHLKLWFPFLLSLFGAHFLWQKGGKGKELGTADRISAWLGRLPSDVSVAVLSIAYFFLLLFLPLNINPFIYFQF